MVYGYARTNLMDKNMEKENELLSQTEELVRAGAETIYKEVLIDNKKDHPILKELMDMLKEGDTVIISGLDRVAKSLPQAAEFIRSLLSKKVSVNVMDLGIFDDTNDGRLLLTYLDRFADFERNVFTERMREGKAIASLDKGYREGRPRKYTDAQLHDAMKLLDRNSYKKVSSMTGMSIATLARERRRQNAIAAKYKAPTEEDIINASLDDQMSILDFPEYLPEYE